MGLLGYLALVPLVFGQNTAPSNLGEQAQALFAAQKWVEALPVFEQLVQQPNSSPQLWYRMGVVYQKNGRLKDAITAYRRLPRLRQHPPAMYNVASAFSQLAQPDSSLAWLNRLFAIGFTQYKQLAEDPDFALLHENPAFQTFLQQVKKAAMPCAEDPHYRAFDFWVGEWQVFNAQNQPAGQSSIQRILGDCVILENWTDFFGNQGKSFNTYHAATQKWHQTWVDDKGRFTEYRNGAIEKDRMQVTTDDEIRPDGTKVRRRMTFTRISAHEVRQFGEQSVDGGQTWTTSFDLYYRRKPAP